MGSGRLAGRISGAETTAAAGEAPGLWDESTPPSGKRSPATPSPASGGARTTRRVLRATYFGRSFGDSWRAISEHRSVWTVVHRSPSRYGSMPGKGLGIGNLSRWLIILEFKLLQDQANFLVKLVKIKAHAEVAPKMPKPRTAKKAIMIRLSMVAPG
jgi:hypothetical protein